jgi:hypothetical protein
LLANTPIQRLFVGFQKHVWILATTSGANVAKAFLAKYNVISFPEVNATIDAYCDALEICTQRMPRLPFHPRINQRNYRYFMMERIEARFIQTLTASLVHNESPDSLILIHDGIWVRPRPSQEAIEQAIHDAVRATGMVRIRVKVSSLQSERQNIIQTILQQGESPGAQTKKLSESLAYITRNDWWDYMSEESLAHEHTPGVQQAAANMLGTRAPSNRPRVISSDTLDADANSLEKYFKRRKLI